MSEVKQNWSSDAFDAISIAAFDGQFEIEGVDGDQVELVGDFEKRFTRELKVEPADRWLQLHLWERIWERPGEAQLTLRLPKHKAWVVDLYAGRGEVEVKGIHARMRVMVGKGEIEVQDCRGVFNCGSGRGEIKLKRCIEAEVPERPPMPQPEMPFQVPPRPTPPPRPGDPRVGEDPRMGGEFHFHFGHGRPRERVRTRIHTDAPWDCFGFTGEDWAEWGAQFGEMAQAWAQQFASQFVGHTEWMEGNAALSVQIGKGDAELKEVEAKSCLVRTGSGDVKIENGRIETLDVTLGRGSIECNAVLPAGDWEIETRHGDIRLDLPSNTQARLDVATRHGDIDSEVPLVRVARPGPESRHGGRMVGTLGPAEGNLAQISLTATAGDIDIRLLKTESPYSGRPATAPATSPARAPVPQPAVETASDATATSETSRAVAEDKPAAPSGTPKYDSQLAILQALSEGHLSVAEAEQLLRSLDR